MDEQTGTYLLPTSPPGSGGSGGPAGSPSPTSIPRTPPRSLRPCTNRIPQSPPRPSSRPFDDAVNLANATPFGLSAALFTNDLTKAMRFKDRVRAGIVRINGSTTATEYHVPFGGMKESGTGGREQGKAARDFFTEWKTVNIGPST